MRKIILLLALALAPLFASGQNLEGDPPYVLDRAISVWARNRINANITSIFGQADSSRVIFNYRDSTITVIRYIDFDLEDGWEMQEGRVGWNDDDKTLEAGLDGGSVLQIGQEIHVRVTNQTGDQINDGMAVYVNGAIGSRPTAGLANNDTPITSFTTIGLATQDISNNGTGYITFLGLVRGLDTSPWPAGSILWLDSIDGGLTDVRPIAPNIAIVIGVVLRSNNEDGIIGVRVIPVLRLAWLSDVKAQGAQQNWDMLYWNTDSLRWELTQLTRPLVNKAYNFTSNGIGAGEYWRAGFYDYATTDANLNQGSLTVTHGSAGNPYAAHPFIVTGGAGSVDVGVVGIRAIGASIDDNGVYTAVDTSIISADITSLSLNEYAEAIKFNGTVTFELYIVSGSPTTYNLDFNYGYAKYEDFGNVDFTITGIEVVGLAGANDASYDMTLFHHSTTGWTYAATGFAAGGIVIADWSTDMSPDDNLINTKDFVWKRTNLNTLVQGNDSEGVIIRIVTSQNNSVQSMDIHLTGTVEIF